jgi:hypothetical protein
MLGKLVPRDDPNDRPTIYAVSPHRDAAFRVGFATVAASGLVRDGTAYVIGTYAIIVSGQYVYVLPFSIPIPM